MALRYQGNAREPTINWNGTEIQQQRSLCCWCRKRNREQEPSQSQMRSWQSSNAGRRPKVACKFFGRIIIGIHLLITTGLFLTFECSLFYLDPNAFLIIPTLAALQATVCLGLMIGTVTMDPGYFPRPAPADQELEAAYCNVIIINTLIPYNRERLKPEFDLSVGVRKKIRLYGEPVEGDYCFECRHFKDLRTKHCRICGKCVVRHDHHCVVLSCCVGIRNFATFYYFQAFLTLFYVYIFVCSTFVMITNWMSSEVSIRSSIAGAPSVWLVIITVLILLSLGLGHLFLFPCIYCYLIAKDRTSRQLFFVIETGSKGCKCSKVEKGAVPPPSTSTSKETPDKLTFIFSNFHNYLCTSPPPSLVQHDHQRDYAPTSVQGSALKVNSSTSFLQYTCEKEDP